MPEDKIIAIANEADMIIRGYAFKRSGEFIRVFNTNDGISSMVIDDNGTMLETNMDEIEQVIVKNIRDRDSKYMVM
jgi:hypothetical protein